MKRTKSGAMISMRDSGTRRSVIEIMKENSQPLRSIPLQDKSCLKGQIQGLEHISVLEWIGKHMEQKETFCKNFLTNIKEQSIIEV